ncbi:MAG TPA: transketolase [Verrucomicrobia bacterium]|nr:transketolase [Verrucomicrobiota bacterium]
MQTRDIQQLERLARRVRAHIVRMVGVGKKGHLGGGCSAADIVTALYFYKMRHDPKNPKWPDRDRLVLSKGHSCLPQYACLAEMGYFPRAELTRVKTLGAMLQGHPEVHRIPGVEATTGSLGQGISIACGMAAGLKLDGRPGRVYCILGDGELAEGQVWEAALGAAFYKLDNLVAILDNNGLMTNGAIVERYDTTPYAGKWRAFGWHVTEIDGHDMAAIVSALDGVDAIRGRPKMIIARTVKSKGVSFAENRPEFHNGILDADQFAQALRELEPAGDASVTAVEECV